MTPRTNLPASGRESPPERIERLPELEPERYELRSGPAYHFALARRDFCKAVGGGIVVLCLLDKSRGQEEGRGKRRRGGGGARSQEIGAWLQIDLEGRVTVSTGKVEVGQNIRTSLAQVVADELTVPLEHVRLVMADTQLTPYDAGTFGSRTTPDMSRQLRGAAAAAREVLIDRAAAEWKADRAMVEASGGKIVHRQSKQTLELGQLSRGQPIAGKIPESPPVKPPERWQEAGRPARKANGRDFVTGKHRYTTDIKLPGLWWGKVLRPVSFGATLASIDTHAAESIPGAVVVRDGAFVGVAGPTEDVAERALRALKAEWKTVPQPSDGELFELLKKTGSASRGDGGRGGRGGGTQGSIEAGLADAEVKLQAAYTIAYIAHAPLEPRAAVAQWEGPKLTAWTGTQRPFGVRGELAEAFGVPEENVRVIVPDTGAGYGGKHSGEAAIEAARLARAAQRPVKLVWSREEEFTWAYFRPAGVVEISSGARKDGTLTAWDFHNYNSGGSSIRSIYEVPNQRAEFHPASSPLRQGSYRALAATANTFARETHVDELAHALGMNPLEFRRKNLKEPRLQAVLEAAAKAFRFDAKPETGHGFGIGLGTEKGSYVATCVEAAVEPSSGQVRVIRAVSAFECGAIVSPDHLRNQVEGAMVMGLGGALFEAIQFKDGKILNARFGRYRVPRFSDVPAIDVVLLDRKDVPPAGAGETPIIGIAPALGNAIFAASGVRLRSLPLAPSGVVRSS